MLTDRRVPVAGQTAGVGERSGSDVGEGAGADPDDDAVGMVIPGRGEDVIGNGRGRERMASSTEHISADGPRASARHLSSIA